jgi:molecular chaperone GrpE
MKKTKSADDSAEDQFKTDESCTQPAPEIEAGTDQIEADGQTPAIEVNETKTESQNPCQEYIDSLAAKEKDFTVLTDNYLRLAAEFDNFRRRSQKEKVGLFGDSVALVIREILPILDNLDRAELAAGQYKHAEARKIAEGIGMIQKSVDEVLSRLNVSRIDCCGKTFDPELHEAVIHVEDEQTGPSTVVEELRKGYRRDDKVIRPCLVKVAN